MVNVKDNIKKHWKDALIVIMVFFLLSASFVDFGSNSLSSYDSMGYESQKSYSNNIYGDSFAPEQAERMQIKNANLQLESDNFDNDVDNIKFKISTYEGITLRDEVNLNSYSNIRTGYINVKINSENLDRFLEEIKTIGEVLSFQVNVNDVTGAYSDYTNRIARYETQITTYKQMLAKPNLEISDEIQIQNRIDSLEDQIFYLKGRTDNIEEDVSYSSVTISIREKPGVWEEVDFLGLKDGFKLFFESLEAGVQFILLLLGFLLPFGVLYGAYKLVSIPFRKN